MAQLEIVALNTTTPQLVAPQAGDTYVANRAVTITPSAGTALTINALATTGGLTITGNTTGVAIQLDNASYLTTKNASGTVTRLLGINGANVTYIGSIDLNTAGGVQFINGTTYMSVTSAGAVTIGSPTSGNTLALSAPATAFYALAANGAANSYTAIFNGSAVSGQSFGVIIKAGTTSGDYSFAAQNQAGTNLFTVSGIGNVSFYNTQTLNNSAVTISTAGAGNTGVIGLQVTDGVTTSVYGYTVGTTHVIGTTTNHNFSVMTFNSVRLSVTSTGAVTLPAPTATTGGFVITPIAYASRPTSPTTGMMIVINDSGTVTYGGAAAAGGTTVALIMWNGTAWVYA